MHLRGESDVMILNNCSDNENGEPIDELPELQQQLNKAATDDDTMPTNGKSRLHGHDDMHVSCSTTGGGGVGASGSASVSAKNNHHKIEVSSSAAAQQQQQQQPRSRRPSAVLQEILSTRRPSAIMAALTRNHNQFAQKPKLGSVFELDTGSTHTINMTPKENDLAVLYKRKNRRIADDSLTSALSALYAKFLVILGIAMPVTEVLSSKISANVYQGFYVYLYVGSIAFVIFVYTTHLRTRAVFSLIETYHEKNTDYQIKKSVTHFGSFYLRVGAIAFAIGTMVYSGLELGQYFELNGNPGCKNIFILLTPAARMALCIIQMQFIFLNTTHLDMAKHKVIARFGLMHMVATNLCEWLYVLVEETKHEIYHLSHAPHRWSKIDVQGINTGAASLNATITEQNASDDITNLTQSFATHHITRRSTSHAEYIDCQRTNIMGSLVQNASPFLFPCTIEYSLICAVILYEMWKRVKSLPDIERTRRCSQKPVTTKSVHHISVDCDRALRGMFAGILVIVMTIICLIMYFVLHNEPNYEHLAIGEITIGETVLYVLTSTAVVVAMFQMRDLKYQRKGMDPKHASSISLDCTLLALAQTGVYVYAMFSMIGSFFGMQEGISGSHHGLISELFSIIQTSLQTLFILNASWRRCKGAQQIRDKPGREIITFLLVSNMAMWFVNTLIKGQASFRPNHLEFFGTWAWTVITHVSMPLAIFYRFHSTICLFEIWKSAYKAKKDHH